MLTIATSVGVHHAGIRTSRSSGPSPGTDGEVLRFIGATTRRSRTGQATSPAGGFDASADRLEGALKGTTSRSRA